jgi:hypothetical protein
LQDIFALSREPAKNSHKPAKIKSSVDYQLFMYESQVSAPEPAKNSHKSAKIKSH